MVTHNFRECAQSLLYFCGQDYCAKELIVVWNGDPAYEIEVSRYIKRYQKRVDILYICVRSSTTLGALRNIALDHASGGVVCQWDDDDLYHPQRLTSQLQHMLAAKCQASYLPQHFHWFQQAGYLYCLNWSSSRRCLGHPGTLMAFKDVVPRYDESLGKGEDVAVQDAIVKCRTNICLSSPSDLYIYVYHGKNTFDERHHQRLARTYGLERVTIVEREQEIAAALKVFPLNPPVTVVDRAGEPVFLWQGDRRCYEAK